MEGLITIIFYFVMFTVAAKKFKTGKIKSYYGWMALTLFLLGTEFLPQSDDVYVKVHFEQNVDK